MTTKKAVLRALSGVALATMTTAAASAQEVTLKLHQFLPAQANVPRLVLDVWADKIEAESKGRIQIVRPPSTSRTAPVTRDASSDAR